MAAERPSLADNPYPPLFLLPPRPRHLIPDVSVALAALASAWLISAVPPAAPALLSTNRLLNRLLAYGTPSANCGETMTPRRFDGSW